MRIITNGPGILPKYLKIVGKIFEFNKMGKKYYWLTSDYQGDMSTLKMDPQKDTPEQEFLEQHNIWFNEDEKDDARSFLRDLKLFIKCRYASNPKYKDRAKWCTDEWINKF